MFKPQLKPLLKPQLKRSYANSGQTHLFTAVAMAVASATFSSAGIVSKPFRVAFAGATVDGREIKEQWLKDIADTYNPEKYAAEIFPEHWRGLTPGGDFSSQGSVLSVYTQTDTVDGEKALALYAVIAPNTKLIEMSRRGEKKYTSIEVTEDFRGSGKAYLTGLAVTDSPASIATEALHFSASQLHQQISDSIEVTLEFAEPKDVRSDKEPGLFAKALQGFKDRLAAFNSKNDNQLSELMQAMSSLVDTMQQAQEQQDKRHSELSQKVDTLAQQLAGKDQVFAQMKTQFDRIEGTDKNAAQRPPATGSNGFVAIDY